MLREVKTLRDDYKETIRKVRALSCEELYKLVDELRMVRDRVHHLVTHFMLTGYIHLASLELRGRCPELYEALAKKWREKERKLLLGQMRQPELWELWNLQDTLIEHKFPYDYIAIHEHLISCAGDIFREMCQRSPHFEYVYEKWYTLSGYVGRYPGLTEGDIEELNMLFKEKWYLPQRNEYLANLQKLKQATIDTPIDPKRKEVMLASLDMIDALVHYFESLNRYAVPTHAIDRLTGAIGAYFPEFWTNGLRLSV